MPTLHPHNYRCGSVVGRAVNRAFGSDMTALTAWSLPRASTISPLNNKIVINPTPLMHQDLRVDPLGTLQGIKLLRRLASMHFECRLAMAVHGAPCNDADPSLTHVPRSGAPLRAAAETTLRCPISGHQRCGFQPRESRIGYAKQIRRSQSTEA